MSSGDLTPFPSAFLLDTSFLRTLGGHSYIQIPDLCQIRDARRCTTLLDSPSEYRTDRTADVHEHRLGG